MSERSEVRVDRISMALLSGFRWLLITVGIGTAVFAPGGGNGTLEMVVISGAGFCSSAIVTRDAGIVKWLNG